MVMLGVFLLQMEHRGSLPKLNIYRKRKGKFARTNHREMLEERVEFYTCDDESWWLMLEITKCHDILQRFF